MNAAARLCQQSSRTRSYAVFAIDGVSLFVAQKSIHAFELVADVQPQKGWPNCIGSIAVRKEYWPAYCVDSNLEVTTLVPPERNVCVVFNTSQGFYGVLCDRVDRIDCESVRVIRIPRCMEMPEGPLEALGIFDRRIGCIVSVDALHGLLTNYCAPEPYSEISSITTIRAM